MGDLIIQPGSKFGRICHTLRVDTALTPGLRELRGLGGGIGVGIREGLCVHACGHRLSFISAKGFHKQRPTGTKHTNEHAKAKCQTNSGPS